MALVQFTQKADGKLVGVNPALVAAVIPAGDGGCTICTLGRRSNGAGLNFQVKESYEEVFARVAMRIAMDPKPAEPGSEHRPIA